jgi:anhydro-N-acetylmuramic acid kinase
VIVVGLMSGTSADGIDAAVVDLPPAGSRGAGRLLALTHRDYPADVALRLLRAGEGSAGTAEICHLHAYLGELFAQAALAAIAEAGLDPPRVAAIGSHGQTVHHLPEPRPEPALAGEPGPVVVRSTLQLGQPAVIAERTGVTTVADFRPRDLAAGGQGAPLAPYAHALLFGNPAEAVAVQNLGGIGNVTFIPAGGGPADVIAFDTGPANMAVDGLVRVLTDGRETFDRDGARAARGRVHAGLLAELLEDSYFAMRPPKSTGRERFGQAYAAALRVRGATLGLPPDDLVATATALTAASVAGAYRDFLPARPARVILCGGGARNQTLVRMIREAVGCAVLPSDAVGLPAEAVEAVSFAVLARETLAGLPAGLPQVTGASHPTVLGLIAPGRGFAPGRVAPDHGAPASASRPVTSPGA